MSISQISGLLKLNDCRKTDDQDDLIHLNHFFLAFPHRKDLEERSELAICFTFIQKGM